MAKKLGKVEKPAAEKFEKGRKLFLLPLVFAPDDPDAEFNKVLADYWQEAKEQINKLEEGMTRVSKVYHELISLSGDEGMKAIDEMDAGSKPIVKGCLEKGAAFYPVEDRRLMTEFIDWSRCLSVGLFSRNALEIVDKEYNEVQQKRQDNIVKIIDETLKGDEVGMLVAREELEIQFPQDVEVFRIAPPSLDKIKNWFREHGYAP